MSFQLPEYREPDLSQEFLAKAPDVKLVAVEKDFVAQIIIMLQQFFQSILK